MRPILSWDEDFVSNYERVSFDEMLTTAQPWDVWKLDSEETSWNYLIFGSVPVPSDVLETRPRINAVLSHYNPFEETSEFLYEEAREDFSGGVPLIHLVDGKPRFYAKNSIQTTFSLVDTDWFHGIPRIQEAYKQVKGEVDVQGSMKLSWDEEVFPGAIELKVGDRPTFEEFLEFLQTGQYCVEVVFSLGNGFISRHSICWDGNRISDLSFVDSEEKEYSVKQYKRTIYYKMFSSKRAEISEIIE